MAECGPSCFSGMGRGNAGVVGGTGSRTVPPSFKMGDAAFNTRQAGGPSDPTRAMDGTTLAQHGLTTLTFLDCQTPPLTNAGGMKTGCTCGG